MPGLTKENAKSDEAVETYNKAQANQKKYGYTDWYMWCVDHWGTKWDLCDPEIVREEDCYRRDRKTKGLIKTGKASIIYVFQTAWAPPMNAIKKISELFPTLKFVLCYEELGMGFEGTYKVKDGQALYDECHDIEISDQEDDDGEAGMRDDNGKLIPPDKDLASSIKGTL